MKEYLLLTSYDPPPIPGGQSLAWHAWVDGYEETFGSYHGATEQEALDALAERLSEEEER